MANYYSKTVPKGTHTKLIIELYRALILAGVTSFVAPAMATL